MMMISRFYQNIQIFLNILIVITLLFSPNFAFSEEELSEQDAVNQFMAENNVKTGLGIDNRYSQGAFDWDALKCAGLVGAGVTATVVTFGTCMLSSLGTGSIGCASAAAGAGFLALWGAYEGMQTAASNWRKNTKIVNTINRDIGLECTFIAERGLNHQGNFTEKFDEINILNGDDNFYWRKSGQLGDYCYKKEYDHTDAENEAIYNNGHGKIGISFKGKEPFWVAPFECVEKHGEHFCAWREGSYICAESVWCTGLVAGDVMPIRGFIGDPDDTNAKRPCGKDPFSEAEEDDEDYKLVDDFQDNKRCECHCCEGSDQFQECEFLSGNRSCMTLNEKYRTNCIKIPPKDEKINIAALPGSVSAYCYSNVQSGYDDFSFTGKALRCFENTLKNIYFGYTDIYDDTVNNQGIVSDVIIEKKCIDDLQDEDGSCTKSIYNMISSDLENFVSLILTLSIIFIGIRFTIGAGLKWGELVVQFLKIGFVLYFVQGNAWKDGYYDFLTRSSYELASDFYKVTLEDDLIANELSEALEYVEPEEGEGEALEETPPELKRSCNILGSELLRDQVKDELKKCNFFSGYKLDGTTYKSDEKHYAILDSLDCKFSNYIGMNKNNVFPALAKTAFAILVSKASGLFFFVTAMVFLFVAIIFMLKITFMLASAIVMINFFILLSPIMIPMVLIGYTKKFFDKWLSSLIGFSLQPFLVFALISLLMILIDHFYSFIAAIYDIEISYIQNNNLGIFMPKTEDISEADAIIYLLQFTFLLVVVIHIFDKFAQILSHLSGAGAISNIIKSPNFEANAKKAMKFAAKTTRDAAIYATQGAKSLNQRRKASFNAEDNENNIGDENNRFNPEDGTGDKNSRLKAGEDIGGGNTQAVNQRRDDE